MIISNLAICPPKIGPSLYIDSSLRSQDDLNHQNQKNNKKLQKEINFIITDTNRNVGFIFFKTIKINFIKLLLINIIINYKNIKMFS